MANWKPQTTIHAEGFEYIQLMNGVTAHQFAVKFGIQYPSAQSWLSKWCTRGYLKYNKAEVVEHVKHAGRPKGEGIYTLGEKEWESMYYDNDWLL
jgi:hypothetical protein